MFAMEQDLAKERSVLDHTSKKDYFLKFQKGDFDDILLIYSDLTLQGLFTFHFIFTKALSSRNHCPYFTFEKTEAKRDCDQRHSLREEEAQGMGHRCPDSGSSALPITQPKVAIYENGP